MRSHPVVGSIFILAGLGLLGLGAFSRSAPAPLSKLPVPPEIIMPFLFWIGAVWCIMFGLFFMRARTTWGDRRKASPRF